VRRLKERYPDVNVRVLYHRDYSALVNKYGMAPPKAG